MADGSTLHRMGRTTPQDPVDEWIRRSSVRGSFIDIGGIGENCTNERVTWARSCGFERVAMADLEDPGHPLWTFYEQEAARIGVTGVDSMTGVNVDDPALETRIGKWDMVHSTGILYHCPNPIHTLLNYTRITASELIVNTVVIPQRIVNREGVLLTPSSGALFLPALSGRERKVLGRHYRRKFNLDIDAVAPPVHAQAGAVMPYLLAPGQASYYPWWWLYTVESFEGALRMLGMTVVDRWTWEDHCHFVWLRRR